MKMYKGFKYRIYPTKEQREYFEKCFGANRFLYNYFINYMEDHYKETGESYSQFDLSYETTRLKSVYPWLKDVDSTSLHATAKDVYRAYQNFFKKRARHPSYKSKKFHTQSFRSIQSGHNIKIESDRIKLPKIPWLKTINKLPFYGKIKEATVTKTASNRYFVSIISEIDQPEPFPETNQSCEIRFDPSTESILINDRQVAVPNFLRSNLDAIRTLQKELKLYDESSADYNRCRIRIARIHEKVTNQRTDFIQKLTLDIVKEFDHITIHDFSVSEKMTTENEDNLYTETSWKRFVCCITYKSDWYGRVVEIIK